MQKRYRIVSPLGNNPSDKPFEDRLYVQFPADKPEHPTCFEGEWVCSHWPCPVGVVRLRVKAMYHQHLPRLRCPLCLRTLDFRYWLNVVALQEVPARARALSANKLRVRKSKRTR